jgi:hypothetical protein
MSLQQQSNLNPAALNNSLQTTPVAAQAPGVVPSLKMGQAHLKGTF